VPLAVASLVELGRGYAPYRPSFTERQRGTPRWSNLGPMMDQDVAAHIRQVLASGDQFGGMVTPRWPESSFTNAAFGLPRTPREAHAIIRRAGYCAFWYRSSALPGPDDYDDRARRAVRELERRPRHSCMAYRPRYLPDQQVGLCHFCFREASAIAIPLEGGPPFELEGFYDLEADGEQRFRWTNGDSRVRFRGVALRGDDCRLLLRASSSFPYEVFLDGTRLESQGDGSYALPATARSPRPHQLSIRSLTFRPPGGEDRRALGVQVWGAQLQCID
jgi:hypothetical protein